MIINGIVHCDALRAPLRVKIACESVKLNDKSGEPAGPVIGGIFDLPKQGESNAWGLVLDDTAKVKFSSFITKAGLPPQARILNALVSSIGKSIVGTKEEKGNWNICIVNAKKGPQVPYDNKVVFETFAYLVRE